jgi:glucose-1-phosphate thymidylyltransferase
MQIIEERQGLKVSCLEEIAFKKGFIGAAELKALAQEMKNESYRNYLLRVVEWNGRKK